ncbi:MAG: HAD-IIIA family hydrolase [Bacteroidaceae bacterium]|nr:HAD-IIIA family hydrolase [Bacteroidaceae bacterium]
MNKLVIFDLDGTLLNTIADLAAGVNHTLAAHDLPQHTIDEYTLMVGNGMRKLIMRALPGELAADDAVVDSMLAEFLSYYADHIDVHTKPYPGVPELISTLSAQGYKLAVASNKIQAGAEKLIQKFFPDTDFVAVMGNSPLYPLKPDAALVEYIMDKAGTDRAHTVMVGDSGTDIQTARNAGIPVIAVSWGFRPRHELTVADFIADDTSQVIAGISAGDSLEINKE